MSSTLHTLNNLFKEVYSEMFGTFYFAELMVMNSICYEEFIRCKKEHEAQTQVDVS